MFAGTAKQFLRIAQPGSLIEAEVNVFRINRDMTNTISQAITVAIAKCECTVGVVDIFIARRQFFDDQCA